MTPLRLVLVALLMVSTPIAQRATSKGGARARTFDTAHLKITTATGSESSRKLPLFVDIRPKPRMHVYAPGQEGYIGVALTLDPNPAFTSSTPAAFPQPEKMFFKPLNETQLVYSKPFRIVQTVTRSQPSAEPLTIKGSLRYQACDDKVCFLPQTVELEWTIASKPIEGS